MSSSGLHTEVIRPADRPTGGPAHRLVLAHGFTQNGRCWGDFAGLMAAGHEVVLVDAPGHGHSSHDDANLWRAADLLATAGGPAVYVGYSMGGRTALHAALAKPEAVKGLVLIGATAGLENESDRAERRLADAALADQLLADGLPAFLDRWLAAPLFAGLDAAQATVEQRLTNRAEGLAASLRNCGTGTQESLWPRLAELTMPVLIVVGSQDQKFGAIGRRMMAAMTNTDAELVEVAGGHAVHLEQPAKTAVAILEAITRW